MECLVGNAKECSTQLRASSLLLFVHRNKTEKKNEEAQNIFIAFRGGSAECRFSVLCWNVVRTMIPLSLSLCLNQ